MVESSHKLPKDEDLTQDYEEWKRRILENAAKAQKATTEWFQLLDYLGLQTTTCRLNEDVRALEFCLNFHNKDPETVALIAKKPVLGLSSWRQAGWWHGNKFIRSGTVPGWHGLGSPQVCIPTEWNWSHLLFCFKQKTVSCPIQNIKFRLNGVLRILLGFLCKFLILTKSIYGMA